MNNEVCIDVEWMSGWRLWTQWGGMQVMLCNTTSTASYLNEYCSELSKRTTDCKPDLVSNISNTSQERSIMLHNQHNQHIINT